MEKTQYGSRTHAKQSGKRRAVGAVVGGTILATILFTSVLIYFLVILQTENEKSKNEVQAARLDEDKKIESYIVGPLTTATDPEGKEYLNVRVHNGGPLPLEARYVLVTSDDPPTRTETVLGDIYTGPDTSQRYLNPGETAQYLASVEGDIVDPNIVYKVDVISSRGNIVSATFPPDASSGAFNSGENVGTGIPVYLGMGGDDGTKLLFRTLVPGDGISIDDDDGDQIIIEAEGPPLDNIVQGTGAIQLDFKSFGAIFPNWQPRGGVDQSGWLAKSANATGYPGFAVPAGPQVYYVERIRNLDDQGTSISLGRSTGLTISQGKCPSGQCPAIYLCLSDINAKTVSPLNDPTNYVTIPATPQTAGKYVGWQDIVFCANNQATTTSWNTKGTMSNINSVFMVARGVYTGSGFPYAQTIPYPSTYVANQGAQNLGQNGPTAPNMIACLRTVAIADACVTPTSADSSSNLKYSAAAADLINGNVQLYIHINNDSGASGYYATWIYPSTGQVYPLASNFSFTSGNYLVTSLPSKMSDGVTDIQPGYYTIALNSPYNANSDQDIYYFTFQVT